MLADPVANVRSALTAAGARDTVKVLPGAVPTAAAAADALGCDVAAITNSLVFEVDGTPLLILASGAAKVDVRLVASQLGTGRIRRAAPDFVLHHTGQEVGGVAPVGHPAKIRTLLDVSLEEYATLWAGAATTTRCSPSATASCSASRTPTRCGCAERRSFRGRPPVSQTCRVGR
jgi:prolyl-tRNA editing enzyme YbaK/EbsC (Cys-tRNA(Pro) deacylase)